MAEVSEGEKAARLGILSGRESVLELALLSMNPEAPKSVLEWVHPSGILWDRGSLLFQVQEMALPSATPWNRMPAAASGRVSVRLSENQSEQELVVPSVFASGIGLDLVSVRL